MLRIVVAGFLLSTAHASANVHPERAAMIEEIKNTPGVLWKAVAHPRFASQAPGASKSLNGVKGDWKAAVEAAIARGEIERLLEDSETDIPDNFDSEKNWPQCAKIIGDIRDQSNCGCCWAFGGVEAASDRMCIATNGSMMFPLSAQDVCFNANPDGCDGGMIDTPWRHIKVKGAVTGGQYQGSGPFGKGWCSAFSLPHCHHHGPQGDDPYPAEGAKGCPHEESPKGPRKCDADANSTHSEWTGDKYTYDGQTQSASGEKGIQQMIMKGGPVETAFTVYSDFENYAGGIYHHVSGSMAGGHAVKMVGWGVDGGVKYWKVANSWNPYWGEKGYFRIRRGNSEGGIEDSVVGSSPTAKWSGGKGPSPGPSPRPSPRPSPGPSPPSPSPHEGECVMQDKKAECRSTTQKGKACKWCELKAIHVGICQDPDVPCDGIVPKDRISSVVV